MEGKGKSSQSDKKNRGVLWMTAWLRRFKEKQKQERVASKVRKQASIFCGVERKKREGRVEEGDASWTRTQHAIFFLGSFFFSFWEWILLDGFGECGMLFFCVPLFDSPFTILGLTILVCHHPTLSQIQLEFKRSGSGMLIERGVKIQCHLLHAKLRRLKGLNKRTTSMKVDSCVFR